MAKAYSADMRRRVIDRVESGASRREAAEHYEVSPSTAVIWVKCLAAAPVASDWWTMCRKAIGRRSPSWPRYPGSRPNARSKAVSRVLGFHIRTIWLQVVHHCQLMRKAPRGRKNVFGALLDMAKGDDFVRRTSLPAEQLYHHEGV
jgi:hypothetical protein